MSAENVNRRDPSWNHGTLPNPKDTNKIVCNYCSKETNGGVNRFKKHLVGGYKDVKKCPKCPEFVRDELKEYMVKKKELRNKMDSIPHFDELVGEENEFEEETMGRSHGKRPMHRSRSSSFASNPAATATSQQKRERQIGPIDWYFHKDEDEVVNQRKKDDKNPKNIDEFRKKMRDNAVQKFARWMYDAGISFNTVKCDSFAPMIEAIGAYGPGMKPPSYHEMRVTYLAKEKEHTKELMKDNEIEREKYGCTLMADGWRDRKGRALINFLVNSPRGSVFIRSIDASSYAHTGDKMFMLFDSFVQEIGEKNVVQVVTDSASSNVAACKLLEAKYPHLYWAPCAAHCIDLMFEDIFKLPNLKRTHERAVTINGYIYNRTYVLNLMREFTGQKDMIRPAKTRFATAFLTLSRFQKQKHNLRKMFTSNKWIESKFAKEAQGKKVMEIIMMPYFWNNVAYAVKLAAPLVHVLRIVDGEKRPAMGYIYEAMDRAKEAIAKAFDHKEEKYKEAFKIIDRRWSIQLHRPLHAAGHFLNPQFFYTNPDIQHDEEVMKGLHESIERLVPDVKVQDAISDELDVYMRGEKMFALPIAIRRRSCESKSPAEWWATYGSSTPNLQKFAIKVLSLTCSSSGCERNWSVFEQLHSTRRNRLAQKRLNDLVYIKYNRALRRRYDMRDTVDPIALTDIDESTEWMVGVMENEEDLPVFEGEDLTWGDVGDAMGVDEPIYNYRSTSKSIGSSKAVASSKGSKKSIASSSSRSRCLIDDEELEETNFDDSEEEVEEQDNDCYKSGSEEENTDDENDHEEDQFDDDLDF